MTSVSAPFNVDLMRRRRRCHCLRRRRRRRCQAISAVAAVAAVAAASATNNAVSVAVTDICWLILVCPAAAYGSAAVACPHHCHCWLPMSLAMAAIVAMVAAEMAAAVMTEHLDLFPG